MVDVKQGPGRSLTRREIEDITTQETPRHRAQGAFREKGLRDIRLVFIAFVQIERQKDRGDLFSTTLPLELTSFVTSREVTIDVKKATRFVPKCTQDVVV